MQQSGLERGELLASQQQQPSMELVSVPANRDDQLLALTEAVKAKEAYKIDQQVMANYKGKGTWYPGKIVL